MAPIKSDHSTTNVERLHEPVGVVHGIDLAAVSSLPDFDPRTEVTRALGPRCRRGKYMSAAEVDLLLEPYLTDAEAGVPDTMLAQRAGEVSVEQVRRWRRRHRVDGRRGRPPAGFGGTYLARSLLGESVSPIPHVVASPVGGTWRVPSYLLRQPLQFESFCEMVAMLAQTHSTSAISGALGFAERDVVAALKIYEARGSG